MLQYILLDASFVMEWHFNYNFCLSPLFCISFTEYLYFLQPLKLYLSRFLLLPLLQICASSSQQCFFVFVPNPYFLILLFQLLISGRITKHGVASPFTQPYTHSFIHSFIHFFTQKLVSKFPLPSRVLQEPLCSNGEVAIPEFLPFIVPLERKLYNTGK